MDIKEFVKEAINGIAQAVYEINDEGFITVCDTDFQKFGEHPVITKDGKLVREIKFNVCVEVSDRTDKDAGFKLAIVRGGIDYENSNTTKNVISFSLPVAFLPPNRKKNGQVPKD